LNLNSGNNGYVTVFINDDIAFFNLSNLHFVPPDSELTEIQLLQRQVADLQKALQKQ